MSNKLGLTGMMLILMMLTSGCSSYTSSFGCKDAEGASCMAMDRVDEMIGSGEIVEFAGNGGREEGCRSGCKGGCKAKPGGGKSDNVYELLNKDFLARGNWHGSTKYYSADGKEIE